MAQQNRGSGKGNIGKSPFVPVETALIGGDTTSGFETEATSPSIWGLSALKRLLTGSSRTETTPAAADAAAAPADSTFYQPSAATSALWSNVEGLAAELAAPGAQSGHGSGGNPDGGASSGYGSGGNPDAGGDGHGTGGNPDGGSGGTGHGSGGNPDGGGGTGHGNGGNPDGGGSGTGYGSGGNPDGGGGGTGHGSGGNPDGGDGTGHGTGGNPDGGGEGTGYGSGGNPDAGGSGEGGGEGDGKAVAPNPQDVLVQDYEAATYRSDLYKFGIGDITVTFDGDTLADMPECLDLTQSKIVDGAEMNPIDSEFGFYVTEFIGAEGKVLDYDFGEGWAGMSQDGEALLVSNASTDKFSVPAKLGTWLEGIGGSFVKASTEHYTVMQSILSDQAYPGDTSGYYQLDDDLKIIDYLTGDDGMPVDELGDPSTSLVEDVMHGFYVKEMVEALKIAEANGAGAATPINYSMVSMTSFMPNKQDFGDTTIMPDDLTIVQESQSWDQILGEFTIAADTRLQFEFSADVLGEIHGIMFTNGEALSRSTTISVAGSQDWGLDDYKTYVEGSGLQSFDIPIGELFTGSFDRVVFLTDDDAGTGADSTWSNVTLVSGTESESSPLIDFDRDGLADVYRAYMSDMVIDGTERNVAVVDIGDDGVIDYYDGNLNGFGTYGIADILKPNESSIIEDIAFGDDYSVTLKDDGKLLYRWGNAIKRPNDVRIDAKIELPDEWTAVEEDGDLLPLFHVTAAELVVHHTVTNNPNDQIRPEDFENEAAIGILPSYEVNDLGQWVSTDDYYAGDGTFYPTGTVLKDPALAALAQASTLGDIGAISADLAEGYTVAWYTTLDREPFTADLDPVTGEYEVGPRWRLQPTKLGQDLPGVENPIDPQDAPPVQSGEAEYSLGADMTTVLNLLDWNGVSPMALSAGWMTDAGEVSDNGVNMTEDFDIAFYVKGDQKPVALYDAQLVMSYEEVELHEAGTAIVGTAGADVLVGLGDNSFDFVADDGFVDLAVFGYGASDVTGLGFNEVHGFTSEEDAVGLIGFGLDPDNYNIHITQEVAGSDLELSYDDMHFATLFDITEELGADAFYFA